MPNLALASVFMIIGKNSVSLYSSIASTDCSIIWFRCTNIPLFPSPLKALP